MSESVKKVTREREYLQPGWETLMFYSTVMSSCIILLGNVWVVDFLVPNGFLPQTKKKYRETIKYTKRCFLMLHIPQLTKWQPKPKIRDNYNCPFILLIRVTTNVFLPIWYWIISRENQSSNQHPLDGGWGGGQGAIGKAYRATKFFKLKTPLIVRGYIFCEPDKGFIKERERDFSLRFHHLSWLIV